MHYNKAMKKFRIIATTDIHGTLYSHSYLDHSTTLNSLSRISTAIKHYRDLPLITIDNGDILQGSPLTTYNNRYQQNSIMAQALNTLNYDFINLGNHDFNYGVDVLKRYLDESNSINICCNILIKDQPIGSPIIYNIEGVKLGLIGVVTDYLPNWEKEENLQDITILNVKETVLECVEELKEHVDHIVVVYHGGFEKDLITGEPTEVLTGENVGYELSLIEGIDVLISGHQHRSFSQIINNTLCLQCAHNASEFMLIEYDGSFSGQIIKTDQFEIDKDFEETFNESEALTQKWLDTDIGIGPDMRINDVFEAQLNKSTYTSFVNQVALDYFKADFAFSSLFNQSPGLKPQISMRDLVASYPYPNTWVLIEIDKPTLLEYLEYNAEYFDLKNNEITINSRYVSPKLELYNYDMGDGLSYTIDVSKPYGHRITNLELPDKETFKMVVNNYRASGGGKFFMIKNCKKIKEDPNEVIDLLYDYILNNSPLQINHINNIKVIK